MKTLSEITNIIAKQIANAASVVSDDYDVVVCPQRIFVEDYLPREEEYVARNHELPSLDYDDPNESPYKNKVFVVVDMGSGQMNMAVSNSNVTIQVLSEENDFEIAHEILETFISNVNFKYQDELTQAYFWPQVVSSTDAVYTGFRALLSCRGFVRVPEPGYLFAPSTEATLRFVGTDGIEHLAYLPFVNLMYNWSSQPDPQSFAGYGGATMALNRQSTRVVTFSTYLKYTGGNDEAMDELTRCVLGVNGLSDAGPVSMNRKYRITIHMSNGAASLFTVVDGWYVLTGVQVSQELGDISPWTLSFTEALKEEK